MSEPQDIVEILNVLLGYYYQTFNAILFSKDKGAVSSYQFNE